MVLAIPKPSIFAAKNEYGNKQFRLAGHTEQSSEDNKEYYRLDPHAQEEKRMNIICHHDVFKKRHGV